MVKNTSRKRGCCCYVERCLSRHARWRRMHVCMSQSAKRPNRQACKKKNAMSTRHMSPPIKKSSKKAAMQCGLCPRRYGASQTINGNQPNQEPHLCHGVRIKLLQPAQCFKRKVVGKHVKCSVAQSTACPRGKYRNVHVLPYGAGIG